MFKAYGPDLDSVGTVLYGTSRAINTAVSCTSN